MYAGDYASVHLDLKRAIYGLHFLAKDRLPERDQRSLCYALQELSDSFYDAHTEHRMYIELLEIHEATPPKF
ncbi:hypothetical protein FNH22_25005 [Fulvivirga sp. M361]|uniref:hypothetical protein n=1 Tax=Fulvivirga sp. M361 TaxID=2594266 RepID=UPI00117A5D6B|nr:hypothetical protein [Fulvivirga sp. M361]TRX50914.1 hypothetical protein FNH22_25005 [Fulvivirga sp. M361]